MIHVRTLGPGDETTVASFLARHADASMFLRSNLRAAGLAYAGRTLECTWAGAFADGELVGVAAHAWNGVLLVQAPRALADVVRHAVDASGRAVRGILAQWTQLLATRGALGLDDRPARVVTRDDLYALDLERLIVPEPLACGRVRTRVARDGDLDLLIRWRAAYRIELMAHPPDDPALPASSRDELAPLVAQGDAFLLECDGAPVAFSVFNAKLPDCVQIGSVYTPPGLRGHGHARAVVAGSLLAARAAGVARSILFTGEDNEHARRAYLALGYEIVGDYGNCFVD